MAAPNTAGAPDSTKNGDSRHRQSTPIPSAWSDEENLQYSPLLARFVYLAFCTLYVLASLLPLVALLLLTCAYLGWIPRWAVTAFAFLVALDFAVPVQDGYRPKRKFAQALCRVCGEGGRHYMPARSVFLPKELDKNKSYILASWPHGLLGGGGHFCFIDFHERGFHPIFSGIDILKYIPFLRRFFASIGFCDASKKSLSRVLNVKKHGPTYPYNVVHLVVGGVGEMFYSAANGPEQIVVSKRKGFIKLAIETGADIIPMYSFGTNRAYYRIFGPKSFLAKLSSVMRVSLLIWFGRWWIPMSAVPFRVPTLSVTGDVFVVPKLKEGEEITRDMVNKVHSDFCQALRKLFDEYKVVYVKEMGAPKEWLTMDLRFEDE